MKTLINGRLIEPDERGDFKICAGAALNFDEKIISIGEPLDGAGLYQRAHSRGGGRRRNGRP